LNNSQSGDSNNDGSDDDDEEDDDVGPKETNLACVLSDNEQIGAAVPLSWDVTTHDSMTVSNEEGLCDGDEFFTIMSKGPVSRLIVEGGTPAGKYVINLMAGKLFLINFRSISL
jgi:hypothetical protein